jgi:hypothetical protein
MTGALHDRTRAEVLVELNARLVDFRSLPADVQAEIDRGRNVAVEELHDLLRYYIANGHCADEYFHGGGWCVMPKHWHGVNPHAAA